ATNPGSAGVLDTSWTAPTKNTDGSALTDLAAYRVYYGTSASPCPGGTFVQVPSTVSSPPPNQTVSLRLTNLTTGTLYTVSVTAVDTGGTQSACSTSASAVAQVEIAVSPTTTTSFGNVNIGSVLDQVFTVQNTRAGTVTGTASVSAPFASGTAVTLTAAPAAGSTFSGWSGGGCSGSGTCTVTMSAATSVTATFALQSFTLTVSKAGAGSGTVTSAPAGVSCGATCSAAFASGTSVTLTAAPAAGSTFSGWSGGGCAGTGTCTVTVSAATTVSATFAIQAFTLTVTNAGAGIGTVTSAPAGISCGTTCAAEFPNGTAVTLTAAPAAGSAFNGWSGGGC